MKDALRKLAHERRIFRETVSGRFVHLAADGSARTEQRRARQGRDAHPSDRAFGAGVRVVPDLVLAGGGGSNGPRARACRSARQPRLCAVHRIQVTVCHCPPGASKRNPSEHRLFSEISKTWAGGPLSPDPTTAEPRG